MTFREAIAAWKKGPGPENPRQALMLALKGVLMGAADIIPGVSGGTMAFITGIYTRLIDAIRSVDAGFVARLLRLDIPGALARVHVKFLAPLLLGIGLAIVSVARVMHYLLVAHPVQTWSLFFGLIAASILVVGRRIQPRTWPCLAMAVVGAVGAYLLVGLIPVQTPESWWFIFLSGSMAICAMILPGISGAFILLILGKYEYITATLKNPFLPENLLTIAIFVSGCVLGLAAFSRLLHYFLHHHRPLTLSLLTGLMVGAMRKVWPWKEMVDTAGAQGLAENILPRTFDGTFFWAVGLMCVGFVAVLIIEGLSKEDEIN